MKLASNAHEIGNLVWLSVLLMVVALFLGLYGMSSGSGATTVALPLVVGSAIGILVARILKAQDQRISELERKLS